MLGERIKKLRKQKKMTLDALAGTKLTKGMLSLIENNKANPSMESLAFIAEQLGVKVSDLLETVSSHELKGILEQAEKLYNSAEQNKYKKLIKHIEPFTKKLSQGYETARLLELYSYSLYHEKEQDWQKHLKLAADMYDQMNISSNRASIGIFLGIIKYLEYKYSQALEILLKERRDIESTHEFIDPLTRLDLDYHEAFFYFAVGDSESAIKVMEKALTFSKEKKIFYLVDDLYRLAAAHAMMEQDNNKKEYYLKKLKQYGEFADYLPPIIFYKLLHIMTLISEKQEYNKALEILEELLSEHENIAYFEPWFTLEKGKALYYLKRYEEALHSLEKVIIPNVHHPFDLSIFYVMDSYKALIHFEIGNRNEALNLAETAVQKFEPLPDTPYKKFSSETLQKIQKIVG